MPGGKDPGSGVGQLTWGEKRVRVEYRGMLIDTMKGYMEEEWLLEVPTPLLREMVEYVEVDIQSKNVAASLPVAEASRNDTAGHSSDEDSLIDEEVDE